jgi:hypothetical protein
VKVQVGEQESFYVGSTATTVAGCDLHKICTAFYAISYSFAAVGHHGRHQRRLNVNTKYKADPGADRTDIWAYVRHNSVAKWGTSGAEEDERCATEREEGTIA